jgi:hypothetical protein
MEILLWYVVYGNVMLTNGYLGNFCLFVSSLFSMIEHFNFSQPPSFMVEPPKLVVPCTSEELQANAMTTFEPSSKPPLNEVNAQFELSLQDTLIIVTNELFRFI